MKKGLGVMLGVLVLGSSIAVGPATNALSTAKTNDADRPAGAGNRGASDRDAMALFGGGDSAFFDGQQPSGSAFGPADGNAYGLRAFELTGVGTGGDVPVGTSGRSAPENRAFSRMGGDTVGSKVANGVYGYLAGGSFGGGSSGGAAAVPGAPDGETSGPGESLMTIPDNTAVTVPTPGALGLLGVGILGMFAAARRSAPVGATQAQDDAISKAV